MATLRLDAAERSRVAALDASEPAPMRLGLNNETRRILHEIAFDALPQDVRDCEVTDIACFRASQMLNFLTGGNPQMTFSARIWRARLTARRPWVRSCWMLIGVLVDGACVVLRSERDHCETAWVNYVRRPSRISAHRMNRTRRNGSSQR